MGCASQIEQSRNQERSVIIEGGNITFSSLPLLPMKNDENRELRDVLYDAGELAYGLGILKALRANKTLAAIELLEYAMDNNISAVGRWLSESPSKRETLVQILNQVKTYRDEFPRLPDKRALQSETLSSGEIAEIARSAAEAAKILQELKQT